MRGRSCGFAAAPERDASCRQPPASSAEPFPFIDRRSSLWLQPLEKDRLYSLEWRFVGKVAVVAVSSQTFCSLTASAALRRVGHSFGSSDDPCPTDKPFVHMFYLAVDLNDDEHRFVVFSVFRRLTKRLSVRTSTASQEWKCWLGVSVIEVADGRDVEEQPGTVHGQASAPIG